MSDFILSGGGTVYLLLPVTESAKAWADENLPDDAQMLGSAIAVEHRYVRDIANGIIADGLTIES